VLRALTQLTLCCADGVFGAMMDVKSTNDGPVTITLDNHERGNSMQGEETEGVK
jgi:hypothetical protein